MRHSNRCLTASKPTAPHGGGHVADLEHLHQPQHLHKLTVKWAMIHGGIFGGASFSSGLDFETRAGWMLFALDMRVAYVDGALKNRIRAL
jgi:hypothetical protein